MHQQAGDQKGEENSAPGKKKKGGRGRGSYPDEPRPGSSLPATKIPPILTSFSPRLKHSVREEWAGEMPDHTH